MVQYVQWVAVQSGFAGEPLSGTQSVPTVQVLYIMALGLRMCAGHGRAVSDDQDIRGLEARHKEEEPIQEADSAETVFGA